MPEVWLRGPVPNVQPMLMPAAHALLEASEEMWHSARELTTDELWSSPGGGAATVGFHLRHIAGSIDRLLTYARGASLDERQHATLAAERESGDPPADAESLLTEAQRAIDTALETIRATLAATLLEPRAVGRQQLPSTVLGLLTHIGEHTLRHAGQVVTTSKVVGGRRGSTLDDFQRLDIRVGTVISAEHFPEARKPALKLVIDFGETIGARRSSAQITTHYTPRSLVGRQVVAVVNFPERRIAGFASQVLVLGAMPSDAEVILLAVDQQVGNGTRIG